MKLIIDIDDKDYEALNKVGHNGLEFNDTLEGRVYRAIASGTPYSPIDKNDCEGCCHYTYDGDIPYCELGYSIQERCKEFGGADVKGGAE